MIFLSRYQRAKPIPPRTYLDASFVIAANEVAEIT